jgi:dTDP-4-dehydrorhamnose 3,5-epimerase
MEKPKLINNKVFKDERGTFVPLSFFNFDKKWIQSNISVNPKKFTFRGLHFQNGEFAQSKLIKVIQGSIVDFIIDIRENSPNFMVNYNFHMEEGDELLVPKGFAHGFITKQDYTTVQYLIDNDYSPNNEGILSIHGFENILNSLVELDSKIFEKIIINNKDKNDKNFKPYNL